MTLGDPGLACHPEFSGYGESQRLARETDPRTQLVAQRSEISAENAKARHLFETSGPFTNCASDARIWLLAPRGALIRQHALRNPAMKRRDQRQPARMDTSGDGSRSPARGTRHEARGTRHEARGTRHEARGTRHEARGTRHEARGTRVAREPAPRRAQQQFRARRSRAISSTGQPGKCQPKGTRRAIARSGRCPLPYRGTRRRSPFRSGARSRMPSTAPQARPPHLRPRRPAPPLSLDALRRRGTLHTR